MLVEHLTRWWSGPDHVFGASSDVLHACKAERHKVDVVGRWQPNLSTWSILPAYGRAEPIIADYTSL